ncbi:iron chaperone [Flavobacterium sp.]|uniref:iron chaperone n=1 Tax=Flavobacterium sp. TaxID=239 RepID=UPI0039E24BC3
MTAKPENIDAYIAFFPEATQKILQQVRQTIQKAAPGAKEKISYAMPAFELNGNLVYFAAYDKHIGFYALPSGNAAFQKELSRYKMGKGSIQFPIDQPMPLALIAKIVAFRVQENLEKAKSKKKQG